MSTKTQARRDAKRIIKEVRDNTKNNIVMPVHQPIPTRK